MNLLFFVILMVFQRPTAMADTKAVNVLRNSDASEAMRFWNPEGNATIEQVEGNRCFVLPRGGVLTQTVSISDGP